MIAFSSVCLSAMTQDHFQCVEHGCRHSNSDSIQNNIVYIKAAAKDWLQQLNSQCSQKAGDQDPHPCAVLLEQRVEDAKGGNITILPRFSAPKLWKKSGIRSYSKVN